MEAELQLLEQMLVPSEEGCMEQEDLKQENKQMAAELAAMTADQDKKKGKNK